jgi:RIO kinase 1
MMMRIPKSLLTLIDYGVIDEVLRPLMSGKEARVYLVRLGDELQVAKVYKSSINRSFHKRSIYTEGRKTRNSRDQRAVNKRSRHGKAIDEEAWRSTEVNMIYRLQRAGVRVPKPHCFESGVLVMEMITDLDGSPAPRLGEVKLDVESAHEIYKHLIQEVIRMLSAGIVHGDLSDFNILLGSDGPVIIDFPQSVDTAHNNSARDLLLRDVQNIHDFLVAYDPSFVARPYGEEMWDLYLNNKLTSETVLKGNWESSRKKANLRQVYELMDDANEDELARRERTSHPRRRRRKRR